MKYQEMLLCDYAVKVFIAILHPDCSEQYKAAIRGSAKSFTNWYGTDPRMAEVTREAAFEFVAEQKPSHGYRCALLAMLRSFAPEKFPVPTGRKPKPLQSTDGPLILLTAFYSQTYEPNALRSRRPNTKRLYRTTLLKFSEFVERVPTLDDLNDETVNAFAAWRSQQGLSKHSVNKDLFNLLAIWRWAHRKGYVSNWPDVGMEKAPRKTPVAWTEAEVRRLFQAASQQTGVVSGVPAGIWWVTLLSVCWDSAERVGAVIELKWSHVDIVARWVKFEAEYRKGARADNLRRIANDTALGLASIKRWQESAGTV